MSKINPILALDGTIAFLQLMINRNIEIQEAKDELEKLRESGKENFDIEYLANEIKLLRERADNF